MSSSMIIAVNTRLLLSHRMEGIARYIYETTRRMVAAHPEHQFHFFFDRPYDRQFIFSDNVTAHTISPPARHPLLWYWWYEVAIPRKLKEIKADVFLSGNMYMSLATDVPTVMVSHDLNYEHAPENIPWSARKFLLRYSPLYHKKATQLIAVSEATKQDIIKTYNIPPEKIRVAHNSAPDGFKKLEEKEKIAIRRKWTEGLPYFVYVGSLRPRKNVSNLLKAYEAYKKQTNSKHKLVIYGRAAYKTKEITDILIKMSCKEDVIFLANETATVPEIVGAAEAMCFVSLFEGFGIPILEAFMCDVPVITSTSSSMPEVGGDAALLVDPYDINGIANAMDRVVSEEDLAEGMVERGRMQLKHFSWEKSAAIIWEEVERIAQLRDSRSS